MFIIIKPGQVETSEDVHMTFENEYEENTVEEMNHEYSKFVVNMSPHN